MLCCIYILYKWWLKCKVHSASFCCRYLTFDPNLTHGGPCYRNPVDASEANRRAFDRRRLLSSSPSLGLPRGDEAAPLLPEWIRLGSHQFLECVWKSWLAFTPSPRLVIQPLVIFLSLALFFFFSMSRLLSDHESLLLALPNLQPQPSPTLPIPSSASLRLAEMEK